MNPYLTQTILPSLIIAALVVGGLWVGTHIYHRYTGLTRLQSALLWLLAVIFVVLISHLEDVIISGRIFTMSNSYAGAQRPLFWRWGFLFPLLALPFVTRLYLKWIGGRLTEAEKLPGIDGVRAWLGVGNVICAVLLPICLSFIYGVSLSALLALTFGLLLAYPLLNMASQSAQPASAAQPEDLSSEREKVLQLLEAGKITADESAELLNALSHSAPEPAKPATGINPPRKMVLLGAVLLLVGFFLPWISVNPAEEANRLQSQFQQSMNQQMPVNLPVPMNLPTFSQPGWTVRLCGGDIAHGLGWWILLLGVAAAVLPFFATNLSGELQKKVTLGCLGVGAIILLYLFTNNLRYVSIGILFGLAGYVLELIGTLQERPLAR
jgi:hypothetical protein